MKESHRLAIDRAKEADCRGHGGRRCDNAKELPRKGKKKSSAKKCKFGVSKTTGKCLKTKRKK